MEFGLTPSYKLPGRRATVFAQATAIGARLVTELELTEGRPRITIQLNE